MQNKKLPLFITVILSLAFIGITAKLITDPKNFVGGMLITLGITFLIILVIFFLVNKRPVHQDPEMKKYHDAVKQSKARYKQTNKLNLTEKPRPKLRKKRRHAPHLTVIEGNKLANKKQIER